ncbi:prolipoprotein diacylglyceryl transferase [Actinotignum sanguinis]|uniref:Phosphatidylglycerol--prolipoprotein diacylglyceryl transferase n=2 Tax=Actinomycetaceae TaxID=2049 RepID=A0ABZ0RE23_9ACTO|nr:MULTISPECIES: prolipoprotein diacylglyceryl transferase [Actinotignum]WPJ89618.1 prolipoprotein diacylglyceryl transferase [Schaalia turicensis]MDE1553197.1 prolipoprotein diacylglyceryl transferase [Actinotignum sanguinis]MDE1566351.1 prolipoprotein diacylglyceryl transferase [Actinotignum sanguinis]MDE1577076.1 prolipoprotein diacylglyceryl transferase [Actinotignum sanguinis]MDE1642511.1 prolipoprotein diacylglyceryl transferase [Actinotignum sanguinis]
MIPTAIPAPEHSEWVLFETSAFSLSIKFYAIAIVIGIIVAYALTERRYVAKGATRDVTLSIALWAVIFGIIGGRLYHVITDYQLYFGPGRDPWRVFDLRGGGLGIWGAVALGGVGAWIGCRRNGVRLLPFADALAPGLLIAQAIGRLGNYFNQELFGGPTALPWGLEVDAAHRPAGFPPDQLFHPTFLYESLWCLGGAVVLLLLEKRFHLVAGQLFAAYVIAYTLGRVWIENLRIDPAHLVAGLRLNVWTSLLVLLGGIIALFILRRAYLRDSSRDHVWLRARPEPETEGTDMSQNDAAAAGAAAVVPEKMETPGAARDSDAAAAASESDEGVGNRSVNG